MTTIKNSIGRQFIDFLPIEEREISHYDSLGGSFAVITCQQKFLICFNKFRNQWELPAGRREEDETPMECATRELYEETGQTVTELKFKGLMKVRDTKTNTIKYNPVYFGELDHLSPFIENEETTDIKLWSPEEDLYPIDSVDFKLLTFFG